MANLRIQNSLNGANPPDFYFKSPGQQPPGTPVAPGKSASIPNYDYSHTYSFNIAGNRTDGNVISFGTKMFTHGIELIDKVDTNYNYFIVRVAPKYLGDVSDANTPDVLVESCNKHPPHEFDLLNRTSLQNVIFINDIPSTTINLIVNVNNSFFQLEKFIPSSMLRIINPGLKGYVDFIIQNYSNIGRHRWVIKGGKFDMMATARNIVDDNTAYTDLTFEDLGDAPQDINITIQPD